MATIGETLRAVLVADATVPTLVSGRIFPNVAPQGATAPFVRYLVVDETPWNVCAGGYSRRSARFQVDAYATKYLDAHALADAIVGALVAITGPAVTALLLSKRDGYEDETKLHRVSMDFTVTMEA